MNVYKIGAWVLVGIPTLIVLILMWFTPQTIIGTEAITVSFVFTLLSVAISYYGLIFALCAALQVQEISNIYFFRVRSPDLLKKIKKISKEVSDFGNEPSTRLSSQRFFFETSVALRSAKRVNNKHVKKVANEAELSLNDLKNSMRVSCAAGVTAGEISSYWDFYQKISELMDELITQIEEIKASV